MANYAPNAELLLVSCHLMCLVCVVQMAENHPRRGIMANSAGQPLAWLLNPAGKQASPRLTIWKSCEVCPPLVILGHENVEPLLCLGARIPPTQLAGHPLCPDLFLSLLPATSLPGV
jgi:hypothetical protein